MIEIHVRHGESCADVNWGLTQEGKNQAKAAREYICNYFSMDFSLHMHSSSRRAVETAQLLVDPDKYWLVEPRLKEANWGGAAEPRDFALWRDMYARVADVCREIDLKHVNQNRLIVSHGGTLRMVRAYREGFSEDRFNRLFTEPYKFFTNCQLLIYSDRNPDTGMIQSGQMWVKSVCPWDTKHRFGHDWIRVMSSGESLSL